MVINKIEGGILVENNISLNLTKDEALVLFDFLHRFSDTDKLTIKHDSEKRVLWDINCLLESALLEPHDSKYDKLLEKARLSVISKQ